MIIVWLAVLAVGAIAALIRPRVFIAIFFGIIIFESGITSVVDFIYEDSRFYPQDLLTCALLVIAPILAARAATHPRRAVSWVAILTILVSLPALAGIAADARSRDIVRDLRPALQLATVFPLFYIVSTQKSWSFALLCLRRYSVLAAYLILFGIFTGWRLTAVDDAWTVSTTATASVARGYGFISSYVFLPIGFLLYAAKFLKDGKLSFLATANAAVLLIATFATFVRADILMLFAMVSGYFVLTAVRGSGAAITRFKFVVVSVSLAIGLYALASASDYGRAMGERTLSIVQSSAGGLEGQGTFEYRLRSFDLARRAVETNGHPFFGYGYGNTQAVTEEEIGYYNHNSYAWLLHRAGWVGLLVILGSFGVFLLWAAFNRLYSVETCSLLAAVMIGLIAVSGSSGFLFNGYQPTGMMVLALFVACADGTIVQVARTPHSRRALPGAPVPSLL